MNKFLVSVAAVAMVASAPAQAATIFFQGLPGHFAQVNVFEIGANFDGTLRAYQYQVFNTSTSLVDVVGLMFNTTPDVSSVTSFTGLLNVSNLNAFVSGFGTPEICLSTGPACSGSSGIAPNATDTGVFSVTFFTPTTTVNMEDFGVRFSDNSIGWPTAGPGPGAVPEPATWAMMLAGFGLMGASLRRRQQVRLRFAH